MAFSRALFLAACGLASALVAQPSINTGGIVNVSGYQATLAPDTVFVIFGSGMGPATIATASAPNYPANLSGTSVSFGPASGSPVAAKVVYTLTGQVAGLLPSSITPGTYALQQLTPPLVSGGQMNFGAFASFISVSQSATVQ